MSAVGPPSRDPAPDPRPRPSPPLPRGAPRAPKPQPLPLRRPPRALRPLLWLFAAPPSSWPPALPSCPLLSRAHGGRAHPPGREWPRFPREQQPTSLATPLHGPTGRGRACRPGQGAPVPRVCGLLEGTTPDPPSRCRRPGWGLDPRLLCRPVFGRVVLWPLTVPSLSTLRAARAFGEYLSQSHPENRNGAGRARKAVPGPPRPPSPGDADPCLRGWSVRGIGCAWARRPAGLASSHPLPSLPEPQEQFPAARHHGTHPAWAVGMATGLLAPPGLAPLPLGASWLGEGEVGTRQTVRSQAGGWPACSYPAGPHTGSAESPRPHTHAGASGPDRSEGLRNTPVTRV